MTTQLSEKWKNWIAKLDERTCKQCVDKNGKIYPITEAISSKPFLHPFCRCIVVRMTAISAGEATLNGSTGADWFLKYFNQLPDYYISRKEAETLGWDKKRGNLNDVAPKKCFLEVCITILIVNCQNLLDAYGMKRI